MDQLIIVSISNIFFILYLKLTLWFLKFHFCILRILAYIHSFIHCLCIYLRLFLTQVFKCYLVFLKMIIPDAHAWRMILMRIHYDWLEPRLILFGSRSRYSKNIGGCNGVVIKKLLIWYFDVLRIEISIMKGCWSGFFIVYSTGLYLVVGNIAFKVLYAIICLRR